MLKYHIQTVELTSGQGSIVFSGIPQDFSDLYVSVSARCTGTGNTLNITFNENTTGYTNQTLQGNGSAPSSFANFTRYAALIGMSSETTNTFGSSNIYIPNYTSSSSKSYSSDGASENNGTQAYHAIIAGLWSNASPITSVTFTPLDGTFIAGSSISLYGVKLGSDGVTAASPVATGGVVTTSGGYTIHTFNTSGTFVAHRNLNAEYLIVAGGGGGGQSAAYLGDCGGGGAGGLLTGPLLIPPSSYNVLVGAGGSIRNPGSNSSVLGLTAVGGGFGGTEQDTGISGNGGNGGSGGGTGNRWIYGVPTAGTGIAGQGNSGGVSSADSDNGGGGGGGAGAAGGAPTGSTVAGLGGIGIQSVISGTSSYYAGGGGGGGKASVSASGGLGGGGNGARNTAIATAGSANTGGGGGGAGTPAGAAAGGSGVVIIRYLTP
jgi:hypothetical protein